MKYIIAALFLCFTCVAGATDIEGVTATLRSVDKITGRTKTLEAPVGEVTHLGNLQIMVQRCLKKPPEETPENAAFLTIEEQDRHNNANIVFNGWMFSSNPAISAMEHPIWDIWVLECKEPLPPPPEQAPEPDTNSDSENHITDN